MSSNHTSSEAEAVYDACASIPEGMVITYADLAQLVGRPITHARTVSTILGHRPNGGTSLDPLPWWRVVRSDGSLLDASQLAGPRAQWVNWALDRLADEGVPLIGEGVNRRVEMGRVRRMPIPDGIAPHVPLDRARTSRATVRAAEPCWRHNTVQYTCRDCTA